MGGIGMMSMPADFLYRDVFLKGKPRHDCLDGFRARHPKMDVGRRAKIFAPFDALRGFSAAVIAKDELYIDRVIPSPEDAEKLSRQLEILYGLTFNSRVARDSHVQVSVTYFVPCGDEDHEAYGRRGTYQTVTGICRNVDAAVTRTIQIDAIRIPLEDVLKIEAPGAAKDAWISDLTQPEELQAPETDL
ncbi:MAG: hypothetical protein IKE56_02570 [Lachnospiraceae bacterium]|nr:hypothetical protein [Lachnospiraceae bacterium]